MSNSIAIAAVTATLRNVLQGAVNAATPAFTATVATLNPADKKTTAPFVNIFLYHVTSNAALRNVDVPTRTASGGAVQRPQAALNLHYLISCVADDSMFGSQRLLGTVVSTLQSQPMLTRQLIADSLKTVGADPSLAFLKQSDLASAVDLVKLTPEHLSTEEMSKIWSVLFQIPYVLSVSYVASVVLVDAAVTPATPLPVTSRGVYTLAGLRPVVDSVIVRSDELNAAYAPPSPIVSGSALAVRGSSFSGDDVHVLFGDADVTIPTSDNAGNRIAVTLPAMAAGVIGVQVLQRVAMGTPPAAASRYRVERLPDRRPSADHAARPEDERGDDHDRRDQLQRGGHHRHARPERRRDAARVCSCSISSSRRPLRRRTRTRSTPPRACPASIRPRRRRLRFPIKGVISGHVHGSRTRRRRGERACGRHGQPISATGAAMTIAWAEANQQHVMSAIAVVRRRLERHFAANDEPAAVTETLVVAERAVAAIAAEMPAPPALEQLAGAFRLSAFERELVVLCAAPELDGSFAAHLAGLGSTRRPAYPTFGLALAALSEPHWSALLPSAPLRLFRLIDVVSGDTLASSQLRIDERVLHYLAGVSSIDARLRPLLERITSDDAPPPSQMSHAARIVNIATQHSDSIFQLCGRDGDGKRALSSWACGRLRAPLYAIAAGDIPHPADERDALARLWQREVMLTDAALYIDAEDAELADLRRAALFAERLPGAVFIASIDPAPPRHRPTVRIDVGRPGTNEQHALWTDALATIAPRMNGHVDHVVGQFSLGARQIHAAATEVVDIVATNDDPNAGAVLWDVCRKRARPRLDELAQRIESTAGWDDLVLPADQLAMLHQIAAHVRTASPSTRAGGSRTRGTRGLGISALFSGPSGTGKTMAAEVLAHELRLDLYRIDLEPGGEQVHRRDRKEPAPGVRRGGGGRRRAAVRRSRRAVRQAQRGEGQPRSLRQHRGELSAAAHGDVPRARDSHHQHARARSTRRSCAASASSSSSRSPTPTQRAAIWERVFPRADADRGARRRRGSRSSTSRAAPSATSPSTPRFSRRDAGQPVGMTHLLRGRAQRVRASWSGRSPTRRREDGHEPCEHRRAHRASWCLHGVTPSDRHAVGRRDSSASSTRTAGAAGRSITRAPASTASRGRPVDAGRAPAGPHRVGRRGRAGGARQHLARRGHRHDEQLPRLSARAQRRDHRPRSVQSGRERGRIPVQPGHAHPHAQAEPTSGAGRPRRGAAPQRPAVEETMLEWRSTPPISSRTAIPIATSLGVYPAARRARDAALPEVGAGHRQRVLLGLGIIEIIPPEAPLTLFVWGRSACCPCA